MGICRLRQAVLYVSDVERSVGFYRDVLGFRVVHRHRAAALLQASDSDNDHDLGLFQVRANRMSDSAASVGLDHLTWSVTTLVELAELARKLATADALVGSSDHGVSKSLYGKDPDGIEFEIAWFVPRNRVTPQPAGNAEVGRLDIAAEIQRWGAELVGDP